MRSTINHTELKARVVKASNNRRAISLRLGLARTFLALAITALLVSSSLIKRAEAADGDLDPTFGADGKVTTDFFGNDSQAHAIAIQADGRIIVGGDEFFDGSSTFDFALARYHPDGSLDQTFGAGGKVTTDFFGFSDSVLDIAIQSDGRIVVAGTAASSPSEYDFALARYNADGSLDDTFGSGGKVTTNVGSNDVLGSLAIQTDGKIVGAGFAPGGGIGDDFAVLRYNADGSTDTSFGSGGIVTTDFNGADGAFGVVVQEDGRIVAAGAANSTSSLGADFALARYNTDGSLDMNFGIGGKVTTDFGSSHDEINDIALQTDGRLVVAGWRNIDPLLGFDGYNFALARYNTDGSLDVSFGLSGRVVTDFFGHLDSALGVAIQGDGRIVAAGISATGTSVTSFNFGLARYNTNGGLDTTFGIDGKVVTDFFGFHDAASDVAIQTDGRILAAGSTSDPAVNLGEFAVARYLSGPVMLFDICLQDDDSGNTLQFNSSTGDYLFTECGLGGFALSGTGVVRNHGCNVSLEDSTADRTVLANFNACNQKGNVLIRVFERAAFDIKDKDTTDNTCSCP